MLLMKKISVKKFDSFEKAQESDDLYYAHLPMKEKIEEFLYILSTNRPNNGKIERVIFKYPLGQPPLS